ncbi:hypothetical protein [Serinibacter arcticus]|uniref:hypothetical protein n=1 Tax=Serinibacter arcticus TaxID=1655435 RepID=UPI001091894B|nr:hypothetical protein [Serinibacter arcticus]
MTPEAVDVAAHTAIDVDYHALIAGGVDWVASDTPDQAVGGLVSLSGDGLSANILTGIASGDVNVVLRQWTMLPEPELDVEPWEDIAQIIIPSWPGGRFTVAGGMGQNSIALTLTAGPVAVRVSALGRDVNFDGGGPGPDEAPYEYYIIDVAPRRDDRQKVFRTTSETSKRYGA